MFDLSTWTFYLELAKEHLHSCGMFEESIVEVVKLIPEAEVMKPMVDRLGERTSNYPPPISKLFILSLNTIALKYVDEHQPQAWYRPMFLPATEQKEFMDEAKSKQTES